MMAEAAQGASGRIFLSYRREETAYAAGWLYDRLAKRFGDGQVFKDVDSIELGDDFVDAVVTAVGSCDVLLALIGDRWLTITGPDGKRRLDDPEDFVRLEVETALTRGVRVVPILVAGSRMPEAGDLPPNLARLGRRQALELSPSRFDSDLIRLLRILDSTLAEAREEAREVARQDAVGQAARWFRPKAEPQRSQTPPAMAERHSGEGSLSPAAHRDATGHESDIPADTDPRSTSWPSGYQGTADGTGPGSATWPTGMHTTSDVPWYRLLLGYGRFWFGLLLILAGAIALLANAPHYYGYEKFPSVRHLHVYIELGLGVLVLAGVLLLASALISAAGPSSTPRDPGRPVQTG